MDSEQSQRRDSTAYLNHLSGQRNCFFLLRDLTSDQRLCSSSFHFYGDKLTKAYIQYAGAGALNEWVHLPA